MPKRAVLFDLDGTLADTAPDLGGAVNRLLAEEGQPALPLALLRPHVSGGARALLRTAFALAPEDGAYAQMVARFLEHYANALCVDSRLFPGVAAMLTALGAQGVKWGIVTNKAERFARPLVEALGLQPSRGCVIGGDTAAHPKPHPAPLLLGCSLLEVEPSAAIYVGDDLRDILAGRAAGMCTITAAYGYLGGDSHYSTWQADAVIENPGDLLALL